MPKRWKLELYFFNHFMMTLYLKDPNAYSCYMIEPVYPIGPKYNKGIYKAE